MVSSEKTTRYRGWLAATATRRVSAVVAKLSDSLPLAPRGVIVENVLLRDVQTQQAEQDALRMSFILHKEKQETERKRIEAEGIADFQKIVAPGISAQLLEWKGIEATEKLAASAHTKVVIVGNPRNGLPLVLEPR